MFSLKKIISRTLILFLFLIVGVVLMNQYILFQTKDFVYKNINDIPSRQVALVLGTSPYLANGWKNYYFVNRIRATAELYKAGKIKQIILSGDNRKDDYNEPEEMRKELLKMGIPDSCMTSDYAGLRTLDSVVRAKKIFGQNSFTIISQEFHNYRSVFLAQYYGIDAIAYNAPHPNAVTMKTVVREWFARPKAILDLYIFKTNPRHLGKIELLSQCK